MEIEINMINVENGDAIILLLKDDKGSDVIVIDGGDKHFNRVKDRLDKVLAENGNKKGPDLLINTHIDADHILGCTELIRTYGNNIGGIWAFPPSSYFHENINNLEKTLLTENHNNSVSGWGNYVNLTKENILKESYEIFESYRQLQTMFDLLNKIKFDLNKIKEPTTNTSFKHYNFKVLMPDHSFFDQCINREKDFRDNIINASKRWKVNKASVVCMLNDENNLYLFTGDAEKTTLTSLPELQDKIKFLDVPHHGSIANISKDIVDQFQPEVSFVSAINDEHHPSIDVINWLNKHGKVHITNNPATTWYLKYTNGIINRVNTDGEIIDISK